MKKSLAALAITAAALLGLSACSSPSEPAPAPESVAEAPAPETTEETAPEEPTATIDEASIQACMDLQAPMAEALQGMQQAQASDANAFDKWLASWSELEDAFDKIASSAADSAMAEAAGAAHADAVKIGELMEKVIKGDVQAATDMATAQADFQKSYSGLLSLCAPTAG